MKRVRRRLLRSLPTHRSLALCCRSCISVCMRSMHLFRSIIMSSSDCSLSVRIVSSMALPRIVGRRLPIVSWAKLNS